MAPFRIRRGYSPEVSRQVVPATYRTGRAGAIQGSGLRALTGGLDELAGGVEARDNAIAAEKARQEGFETQMGLLDFEIEQARRFDEAKNTAPLGADGFVEQQNAAMEQAGTALVERLKARGVTSPRALDVAQRGAKAIRKSVQDRAISFTRQSRSARAETELEDAADKFAELVLSDPDQIDSVVDRITATVSNYRPGEITDIEREEIRDNIEEYVRKVAGLSLAEQDPERVVNAMKGGNGGSRAVGTILRNSDLGLADHHVAAVLGNLYAESSFNTGAIGDSGTAFGIAQWREGRVDALKDFAAANRADWRDINTQAHFIVHELKTSHREAYDALIATDNVRDAVAAVAKYYEKPAGSQKGDGSGSHNFAGRLRAAQDILGGKEFSGKGSFGGSDDPVVGGLSATDRLRLLRSAEAEINRRQSAYRAELDIDLANANAAWSNGQEYAGDFSRQRFEAAGYSPEVVEQKYAQTQLAAANGAFIGETKGTTNAELAEIVASSGPTDTASDTFALEDAAHKARQSFAKDVIKSRNDDAASYVATHYPQIANAMDAGDPTAFTQMYELMNSLGIPAYARNPFPKSMLPGIKEHYENLGPTELINSIARLEASMPPEMFQRALDQLDSQGFKHEAQLGRIAGLSDEHSRAAHNAQLGRTRIEEESATLSIAGEVQETFDGLLGNARFGMEVGDPSVLYENVRGLYFQEGGMLDTDNFESDKFERAFRTLVGGSSTNDDTGFLRNGRDVTILPPLRTGTEFASFTTALTPELFEHFGNGRPTSPSGREITQEEIAEDGVYVKIDEDTYQIFMTSDDSFVWSGNDAAPYKIEISDRTLDEHFRRVAVEAAITSVPERAQEILDRVEEAQDRPLSDIIEGVEGGVELPPGFDYRKLLELIPPPPQTEGVFIPPSEDPRVKEFLLGPDKDDDGPPIKIESNKYRLP